MAMSIVKPLARKGYDQWNRIGTDDETFDTNFIVFSAMVNAVMLPLTILSWAYRVARGTATTREAASGIAQYVLVQVAITLGLAYNRGDER